jgi:hypothetical protein
VRKAEAVRPHLDLAEEKEVDVDRAWTVAGATEGAPVLRLDRLREVEQLLGLESGPDPYRGIQEVGLVEDLSDGLRLVERRDGLDRDAVLTQVLDRPAQMGLPVADVRAEPEVAEAAPLAQTPSSSSSDSRSSERSRVTSTPASCTG